MKQIITLNELRTSIELNLKGIRLEIRDCSSNGRSYIQIKPLGATSTQVNPTPIFNGKSEEVIVAF